MRVIIFGASGMVGRGVLLECLEDVKVESVMMINRYKIGVKHKKLKELIHDDFINYSKIENELKGFDACFWTLGISVVGLSEEKYKRITYDFTINAAKVLVKLNPEMTFCYVSGTGTDSSEKGRSMWARVKGKTENELMAMPFKGSYMFRPGYIQPMKGVKSKTGWYNALYVFFSWLYPIFKVLTPNSVTSTVDVGKAMIVCADIGYSNNILHSKEINALSSN